MGEKWNRRKFLTNSLKGTIGLFAVSTLPIGLTACNDEESIDVSSMVNLGPLKELENGDLPKKIPYKTIIKDAWVEQEMKGFVYVNKNEEGDSLLIMSPVCTHLGCTAGEAEIEMQQEGIRFYCPCHGGQYDEFGINVGGPPPRPLDTFNAFVKDGEVYISILSAKQRENPSN